MTFPESRQPPLNGSEVDRYWMQQAFDLAKQASQLGEVPVGAVVVYKNQRLSAANNQPITRHDPTAHAEIVAIRQASELIQNYRLVNTTMYVTLEPCAMCFGAIMHARIKRLVFATWDPRAGAVGSAFHLANDPHFNHKLLWSEGIMHQECQALIQSFFHDKR